MSLQNKMEFEGNDIAEAISKACKTLDVPQEHLDIEVLTTGTSGIFGLCRQKARLRVTLKKEHGGKAEEKPSKRPAKAKSEKEKSREKKKEPVVKAKKKAAQSKPVEKAPEAATGSQGRFRGG